MFELLFIFILLFFVIGLMLIQEQKVEPILQKIVEKKPLTEYEEMFVFNKYDEIPTSEKAFILLKPKIA